MPKYFYWRAIEETMGPQHGHGIAPRIEQTSGSLPAQCRLLYPGDLRRRHACVDGPGKINLD